MPTGDKSSNIVALELEILRRLFSSQESNIPNAMIDGRLRKKMIAALLTHHWRDPENRIVFEALERLPGRSSYYELRHQLPAQATRMGFPDVNWERYFMPENSSRTSDSAKSYDANIETLIANLGAATRDATP
jgi:hypothetical protein